MREWKKLTVLVSSGAVVLAATMVMAQTGPSIHDHATEEAAAVRPPVLIEQGEPTIEVLADGATVSVPTSTVTKFVCGTDTTNLTVEDLRRIQADAAALEAQNQSVQVITGSGLRGGLSITWNVTAGAPPASVLNVLSDISTYYNATLADPVSITINFRWLNLGGGVLGATSSNYAAPGYSTTRGQLIADMDADDVIQAFLPTTNTLPVIYDASTGVITNENLIFVTRANREAIGVGQSDPAATMTINNSFPWDTNESNGVTGGTWGIESVIVHEVAHALGFTSAVDFRFNDSEMMDLYRFDRLSLGFGFNPATFAEFESGPRLVDFNNPNDRHNTDLITETYRMEDGSPSQGSHLRFNVGGIMEAALASGQSFWPDFLQISDLHVMDAIGWDVITGPCTTLGDVDMDGDVDLRDVKLFQECFAPGLPTAAGCECADVAHLDDEVNLLDWEVMERSLMTGP